MSEIIFILFLIAVVLRYAYLLSNEDKKRVNAFYIWLTFTVIVAIIPIILKVIFILFFTEASLNISDLLINGELFIVSVAINSDAIGRIYTNDNTPYIRASSACFLLVIVSSYLFAISSLPLSESFTTKNVPILSLYIFLLTVFSSGLCVLESEG